MTNKYIINKGYYIRNDLESLLIYYDYFSQGISFPILIQHPTISKFIHITLRFLTIALYMLRLHILIYKTETLDDNAIIIIKRKGSFGSTIRLLKTNGVFTIYKKVRNSELFLKEKRFYETYKKSQTRIKLPICKFLEGNLIQMEFLKLKSFQRMIVDGTLNLTDSLSLFESFKNELWKLYKKKKTLIHGDLFLPNIYIHNNKYYLIDFTESHINGFTYDLYVLLFSIYCSFDIVKISTKSIHNVSINGKSTKEILKITDSELNNVEKQFVNHRETRFPGFYEK